MLSASSASPRKHENYQTNPLCIGGPKVEAQRKRPTHSCLRRFYQTKPFHLLPSSRPSPVRREREKMSTRPGMTRPKQSSDASGSSAHRMGEGQGGSAEESPNEPTLPRIADFRVSRSQIVRKVWRRSQSAATADLRNEPNRPTREFQGSEFKVRNFRKFPNEAIGSEVGKKRQYTRRDTATELPNEPMVQNPKAVRNPMFGRDFYQTKPTSNRKGQDEQDGQDGWAVFFQTNPFALLARFTPGRSEVRAPMTKLPNEPNRSACQCTFLTF